MAKGGQEQLGREEIEQLIEDRLEKERREREAALVAQEHRLIHAVGNLARALTHPDPKMRSELTPKAIQALLWRLLPRPVTTTLSVVALLSLAFAWWQTSLLKVQNQQMQTQNYLAEAQRRSAMMSESVEIFRLVEQEKQAQKQAHKRCEGEWAYDCWRTIQEREFFVPSQSTIGRIVSLTQALRPYRYLSGAEDANIMSEKEQCPENAFSRLGAVVVKYMLMPTVVLENGNKKELVPDAVAVRGYIERNAESFGIGATEGDLLDSILQLFDSWLSVGSRAEGWRLSCRASSPERGQLLVSLNAAGIDLTAVTHAGATFEYADLQSGRLSSVVLKSTSLRNARLSGADIFSTDLNFVDLSGADLSFARFMYTKLSDVNLDGARLDITPESMLFLFFMLLESPELDLSGSISYLIDRPQSETVLSTWCELKQSLDIAGTNPKYAKEGVLNLSDYALVTESRPQGLGKVDRKGILMKKTLAESFILFEGEDRLGPVEIHYEPLDTCGAVEPLQ